MLSKQQVDIIERVKKIVIEFLSNDYSIQELSDKINIPTSTKQRDLNNTNLIKSIFADESDRVISLISTKLKNNKVEGNKLGGINSTNLNEPIRDDLGKFIGNKRKM